MGIIVDFLGTIGMECMSCHNAYPSNMKMEV